MIVNCALPPLFLLKEKGMQIMANSDILAQIENANRAFDAYVKRQAAKESELQTALNAALKEKKDLGDYADNDFLSIPTVARILGVSLPTARKVARQFKTLTRFQSGKRAHFYIRAFELKAFLDKGGVDRG